VLCGFGGVRLADLGSFVLLVLASPLRVRFWHHHCPTRGVFLSSLKKEQNKNFKKGNFVVVGVSRAVLVFWGSRVVVNLLVCCGIWIWAWFDCFKVIGFYVRAL